MVRTERLLRDGFSDAKVAIGFRARSHDYAINTSTLAALSLLPAWPPSPKILSLRNYIYINILNASRPYF